MFEHLKQCYSRADQHRALDLLRDPEAYPGLPVLNREERALQIYVVPSFQPMMSWTLYRLSENAFRVRRVRWDFAADYSIALGDPTTYGSDADCAADVVSQGLAELSQLTFPTFDLSRSFGIDGVTFGFRRETSSQFLEFSWWCHPPTGSELLGEWYHRFTERLEAILPAHTDHFRLAAVRP